MFSLVLTTQLCSTLCNPMDCSLPGSSVHWTLQAKVGKNTEVKWSEVKWSEVKSLSRVWLFATLWTVAHQAPPSMGFSRQEYWSELPFPSPGKAIPFSRGSSQPGIEPRSPALQADSLPSAAASAAAKSLQLCPTLCDPIDGSPPGSPVPKILQARTLEWVYHLSH